MRPTLYGVLWLTPLPLFFFFCLLTKTELSPQPRAGLHHPPPLPVHCVISDRLIIVYGHGDREKMWCGVIVWWNSVDIVGLKALEWAVAHYLPRAYFLRQWSETIQSDARYMKTWWLIWLRSRLHTILSSPCRRRRKGWGNIPGRTFRRPCQLVSFFREKPCPRSIRLFYKM